MRNTIILFIKIVLIFIVFMGSALIYSYLSEIKNQKTPGVLIGLILMFGAIAIIKAIWKYSPDKKADQNIDKHPLDKN